MEPCWKYIKNSPIKQAEHIKEEARETYQAIIDGDSTDIEVMDVIQSCITYLAIKKYDQKTIDNMVLEMKKKNAKRGYYSKGDGLND